MPDVTEDTMGGHRLSDSWAVSEITRTFKVTGLTLPAPEQLLEAIRDPDIPKLGDVYPDSAPTIILRVVTVDAEPYALNAARVTCTYSNKIGATWNQTPPAGDAPDVKQVASSTVRKKTEQDRFSVKMTMPPPPSASAQEDQVSVAEIQSPVASLVFERSESAPPTQRARSYVGALNSVTLGGGLYPIGTLMFTNLRAQSDDGGRVWRVTYQFSYDPDGHQHYDYWKNDKNKMPDDGVIQAFEVHRHEDFSFLGLDFDDTQTPT